MRDLKEETVFLGDPHLFCNRLKEYNMDSIYQSPGYKRSRKAYMLQCTVEYLVSLLVTDAFLANLLSNIGISDSLTGIISSFISLAFLFQLLSIFLVTKINNTKKTVIFLNGISQMLFMCMYLIPFVPVSQSIKTFAVIAFILMAYITNYLASGVYFKWANSFVDPVRRAEYSAGKEMCSLFAGIVFTLAMGYVIDRFGDLGNVEGGFLFTAATMLILNICNFISLALIKKESAAQLMEKENKQANDVSWNAVMRNTFGNKNFVSIVIMTVLWYSARYMTVGFLGTFKTKDLAISVGTVQIINIAANLVRIGVSRPFGKFSDRTSYAKGIRWALTFAAAAYFVNVFSTPNTWWLVVLYSVLYNISLAGSNQNSFNITYSYVDSRYIVQAMAIKNSVGGVCGFLVSILASRILAAIQNNHNTLLGIPIYGQQFLSLLSCIILIGTIFYIRCVVERQQIKIQ